MYKRSLTWFSFILVLIIGLTLFTACSSTATGEDAAALKSIADHDLEDIADLEKHIDKDAEDGKLTKDIADTAKTDIDSLKTSFTDISKKLESAAAGATVRAEDLAEGNAFLLKTKDDVDKEVTKLTDTVDNFKTRVESATADDKEDLIRDEEDFETHIDQLKSRIERLTTEGTLTEDEKKAYDDTIGKLKDDLTSAKETIDKLS